MTLQELKNRLLECNNLADCSLFLSKNFHEIRFLFYGLTDEQLLEDFIYLEYEEQILIPLDSALLGKALHFNETIPPSLIAFLILFLSLFERSKHYAAMQSVIDLIPRGSLRDRCDALFEFKYIHNAKNDYICRFNRILELLQRAWEHDADAGRKQCEDLLLEYFLDALIRPIEAGTDIRQEIVSLFELESTRQLYPIVLSLNERGAFSWWGKKLFLEHKAVKTRIVESLHAEACSLVPEPSLSDQDKEASGKSFSNALRVIIQLPQFLDDWLDQLNAQYSPKGASAKINFNADAKDNLIYIGTYFPRTVIESWNIFSELLAIPAINLAFRQKSVIRILDIGSGTGGAIIGLLLALEKWGQVNFAVEITALDYNQESIDQQIQMLDAISNHFSFRFEKDLRCHQLPFDLNGFTESFDEICNVNKDRYDIVLFWKCLSEFYNVNYASALGIIKTAITSTSQMLKQDGLCVITDVTSKDNGYEHFSSILNREANLHDRLSTAKMRTIIPLSCGTSFPLCDATNCFTQRRFQVVHRLAKQQTKIAYRVLAPIGFANTILKNISQRTGYRVNDANPEEACIDRRKVHFTEHLPCGYSDV